MDGVVHDGRTVCWICLNHHPFFKVLSCDLHLADFTKPFNQWAFSKGDLKKVFDVITKGIPNSSMVKWDHLPEQERWALLYVVVEFASPKTPAKKKK